MKRWEGASCRLDGPCTLRFSPVETVTFTCLRSSFRLKTIRIFLADVNAMVFSLDGVSQRGRMGLCANHNPSGQRSRDVVYLALVWHRRRGAMDRSSEDHRPMKHAT